MQTKGSGLGTNQSWLATLYYQNPLTLALYFLSNSYTACRVPRADRFFVLDVLLLPPRVAGVGRIHIWVHVWVICAALYALYACTST